MFSVFWEYLEKAVFLLFLIQFFIIWYQSRLSIPLGKQPKKGFGDREFQSTKNFNQVLPSKVSHNESHQNVSFQV